MLISEVKLFMTSTVMNNGNNNAAVTIVDSHCEMGERCDVNGTVYGMVFICIHCLQLES